MIVAAVVFTAACGAGSAPAREAPHEPAAGLPPGIEFVSIPGGTFVMGSPENEPGRAGNEGPLTEVSVAPFEMMTTPVTWDMWTSVMEDDPEVQPPEWATGDHPVTGVSWLDAWMFLERLHELDPEHIYRLPGEVEWEYACRAGTATRFFWGDRDDPEVMDRYCVYWGNSGNRPGPVGAREPNPWGLYDMAGNVFEWCHDTWADSIGGFSGAWNIRETPDIPYRVVRGGNYRSDSRGCRSAYRYSYQEKLSGLGIGFRAVRVFAEGF